MNLANRQAFVKICFFYCGNTRARHLTPKLNLPKRKIWVIRQNFDPPKLPAIRYTLYTEDISINKKEDMLCFFCYS